MMLHRHKHTISESLPGFEGVNRYWDHAHHSVAAKILPGEYYVTASNELITTVLGSCVSACIRDPVFGVGGMNHFMLPEQGHIGRDGDCLVGVSARYGVHAMELLINAILVHGGVRKNLEVKIFGGGKVLAGMSDIGRRNILFVEHYIETEGLDVLAEDVGDIYPRKVIYNPKTGRARVKKIKGMHNNTILNRETQYRQEIDIVAVAGEVDLF